MEYTADQDGDLKIVYRGTCDGHPGLESLEMTSRTKTFAMTVVRYGRRPPVWIWIKVGLTAVALFVASPLVAPALRAARGWAHWSLEHNQLAPQFAASAATASIYGAVVFTLVLLNVPVAVWKPFLSINLYRDRRSVNAVLGDETEPVSNVPVNR